ncbi:MAG: polyprenyl synthetase family protein [Deltaproteobacteria bacterium]|nr:polyprenyl synthetase family protein [Deltaproteobacteria bacterium]
MLLAFDAARTTFGPELERRLLAAVEGDGVLLEAARYHFETGGKRLRGLLPPWIAYNVAATRGADPMEAAQRLFPLGVAFELIHNGTLVHDDVQDGDTHRRGRPAVWVQFGMPQAVNLGTSMMFLGVAQVLSAPRGVDVLPEVNLAILDIVAGQALEFELHSAPAPTTAMWERMAGGKTAALFSACFYAAAVVSGLPEPEVRSAARFGARLGVFFQLQDDLLDLVGDKQRDVPATDIAEGKVSWPVAWAAERAAEAGAGSALASQVGRLMAIVRCPRAETTPAMIAEALALMHATGAIAAGLGRVRDEGRALADLATNALVPGLVERVLEPIRHAL